MTRLHTTALAALLASAPLIASAEPPVTPDRPASAETMRMQNGSATAPTPVPNVESSAPATPVPMNLPDDATTSEVQSQYGIGIATLVLGAVVLFGIVAGALYMVSRRSWSNTHPTH